MLHGDGFCDDPLGLIGYSGLTQKERGVKKKVRFTILTIFYAKREPKTPCPQNLSLFQRFSIRKISE